MRQFLSLSRRLPLLQVVSNNKSFSVGVQSPTEINAPRGCAVILRRICQLSLTRITHQVSRAFDLNLISYNALMRSRAASVFSYVPNAVSLKYPSPLGPNPDPGVPTTFAFSSR